MSFPDPNTCWQAVLDRAERYDGVFVYGVHSTRIYCRPTCPSRRPRQNQVTFFPTPAAAEAAGYRACQRCHPRQDLPPARELVQRIQSIIEKAETPPSLAELSRAVGRSPFHLQRLFKTATGLTPRQYAAAVRAERFKTQAAQEKTSTYALYAAGYNASSQLYENASAYLGMTPAQYQKGGKGMIIYYQIETTTLGCTLIAASEKGICTIQFGDQPDELKDALLREFPRADLHIIADAPEDLAARFTYWTETLNQLLSGAPTTTDLPLDVLGTAFQQKVWHELQHIPYGDTRTYTQIAEAIGQPSATRAVARACATNPVAVVIPCHRVIRSDGSLAGYRWGLSRKQALLALEKHPKSLHPASQSE